MNINKFKYKDIKILITFISIILILSFSCSSAIAGTENKVIYNNDIQRSQILIDDEYKTIDYFITGNLISVIFNEKCAFNIDYNSDPVNGKFIYAKLDDGNIYFKLVSNDLFYEFNSFRIESFSGKYNDYILHETPKGDVLLCNIINEFNSNLYFKITVITLNSEDDIKCNSAIYYINVNYNSKTKYER